MPSDAATAGAMFALVPPYLDHRLSEKLRVLAAACDAVHMKPTVPVFEQSQMSSPAVDGSSLRATRLSAVHLLRPTNIVGQRQLPA